MLVAAMVAAANWPLFLRMNSLSCKRLAGTWATGQLGRAAGVDVSQTCTGHK